MKMKELVLCYGTLLEKLGGRKHIQMEEIVRCYGTLLETLEEGGLFVTKK